MTAKAPGSKTLEMSRYIDLEIYHAVERSHPFYGEMIEALVARCGDFLQDRGESRLLELGAGTGLATEAFLGFDHLEITAIDIDEECCRILEERLHPRVITSQGDAVGWCEPGAFDLTLSVFAHDHIHHDEAEAFIHNIHQNLKPGGLYLMGGELLPPYETPEERREALYRYHTFIINQALREESFELAQIEINALKSGLQMIGDFKRHEEMFEAEMQAAPFELVEKIKIGPNQPGDVGGVFVYAYRAL
ncbi:MAG: class I SAM-dependent methyltransferase [Magnetococcales bacterium]|nr:class I SAM-dependent methyltransferase [Magnetococcales bacterium]